MFFRKNKQAAQPEPDSDKAYREAWGFTLEEWRALDDAERRDYRLRVLDAGLALR
jgi:hypothetical protein